MRLATVERPQPPNSVAEQLVLSAEGKSMMSLVSRQDRHSVSGDICSAQPNSGSLPKIFCTRTFLYVKYYVLVLVPSDDPGEVAFQTVYE